MKLNIDPLINCSTKKMLLRQKIIFQLNDYFAQLWANLCFYALSTDLASSTKYLLNLKSFFNSIQISQNVNNEAAYPVSTLILWRMHNFTDSLLNFRHKNLVSFQKQHDSF